MARHGRADPARPAGDVLLGDLRAAGQHHRALGRRLHRPHHQPRRLERTNPGHLVPGVQSVHDLCLTPFVLALWKRQAARGSEPSTVFKMALGCFGVALSYLVMVGAAVSAGDGKASWLWL